MNSKIIDSLPARASNDDKFMTDRFKFEQKLKFRVKMKSEKFVINRLNEGRSDVIEMYLLTPSDSGRDSAVIVELKARGKSFI